MAADWSRVDEDEDEDEQEREGGGLRPTRRSHHPASHLAWAFQWRASAKRSGGNIQIASPRWHCSPLSRLCSLFHG